MRQFFLSLGVCFAVGCGNSAATVSTSSGPPAAARGSLLERASQKSKNDEGEIIALTLMFESVDDDGLAQLSEYPRLEKLELIECPRVLGAGLPHVAKLPRLASLKIHNTPVGDTELEALSQMSGLREVSLQRTRCTGAALAHLPATVESLHLGGRDLAPAQLANLNRFSRLKELSLKLHDVPLGDLPALKSLASVEVLDLTGLVVDDASLDRLEGLESLRILRFDATRITDRGLPPLAGLVRLEQLDLGGAHLTDSGVALLAPLVELRALALGGNVTDEALGYLTGLVELQQLDLRATRFTGTGARHLSGQKNLRELIVPSRRLTSEGRKALDDLKRDLPNCAVGFSGA